jgi:NADH dehydrogenase FAD-containing subunit
MCLQANRILREQLYNNEHLILKLGHLNTPSLATEQHPQRITIVGAGFAGVAAIRALGI